jgi:hypothetical protein
VLNSRRFLSWVGTFSPQATDGRRAHYHNESSF